jgi:GGDEF domain-containing protein
MKHKKLIQDIAGRRAGNQTFGEVSRRLENNIKDGS